MKLSQGLDRTLLKANLIGPGRGCGGWEPGRGTAIFPARREPSSGGAHRALLGARPPPLQPLGPLRPLGRGARPSPALPSPPGQRLGSWAGAGAGAAGRAPEVGSEREAARPGGGEAERTGACVRHADGPRVEVGRGCPGCGAQLRAGLGPRHSCPLLVPFPGHPPLGGHPCPSHCPRPPHPSCPLSPVHLPSWPCAPTLPPDRVPAEPYLLRTQHQIRLASSAPIGPLCRLYTCHLNSVHPLQHPAPDCLHPNPAQTVMPSPSQGFLPQP